MASKAEEKAKAHFLTDYRELCERHKLMVVQVDEAGYSPFALAVLDRPTLDGMVQEMLIEATRNIVHDE